MATSISNGAVGPQLKEFIFTDRLGSGTYATVYKAYRKCGSREVVAIKCVEKSSLNKASTENLLTEIKLLKTLHHDHIVQLRDFQWDDKHIYLIMEYCNGGDLSHFIRSKRTLSEYLARKFLRQLASALEYMRSQNVSHMDLKPQNILLYTYQTPIIKVADFGFAHYLQGETDTPYLRGSPLYMAPEIVIKKHYNEKADLWSVGVILYECLFGRAPFASKSVQELEDKIVDTKPIELPHGVKISTSCRHLLHGLLQRDPEKRMSCDGFFAHVFVDLQHAPSNKSLEQAIKLASDAVAKDQKGDYKAAVSAYCKALEYFIPAIHYEKDPKKKQKLREKVKEYMSRAEELKALLKPKSDAPKARPPRPSTAPAASSVTSSVARPVSSVTTTLSRQQSYPELAEQFADNPHLLAALKVISAAEHAQQKEDYNTAYDKYHLALSALMTILKSEPKSPRKELLQKQVDQWLTSAEQIKEYLEVQELKTEDTSQEEEEDNTRLLSENVGWRYHILHGGHLWALDSARTANMIMPNHYVLS